MFSVIFVSQALSRFCRCTSHMPLPFLSCFFLVFFFVCLYFISLLSVNPNAGILLKRERKIHQCFFHFPPFFVFPNSSGIFARGQVGGGPSAHGPTAGLLRATQVTPPRKFSYLLCLFYFSSARYPPRRLLTHKMCWSAQHLTVLRHGNHLQHPLYVPSRPIAWTWCSGTETEQNTSARFGLNFVSRKGRSGGSSSDGGPDRNQEMSLQHI